MTEKAKVIHTAQNLRVYDDGTMRVDNVIISYPKLFKPPQAKNDNGSLKIDEHGKPVMEKYSGTFILPLETHRPVIVYLKNHAVKLAAEKLPPTKGRDGKEIPKKLAADKLYLRDGSQSGKAELEGAWFIKAADSKKPQVAGLGNVILTEDDGVIYPGCKVSVLFRPWPQKAVTERKQPERINANLLAVRYMDEGTPLSDSAVRRPVEDVFSDFEDGSEAGDGLDDDLGDGLGDEDEFGLL